MPILKLKNPDPAKHQQTPSPVKQTQTPISSPKASVRTPSPSKRSHPPTPSSRSTPSKKAETFANKWVFRLMEVNRTLEPAKHEITPTQEIPDPEPDSHIRQVDAVQRTQSLLIAFDEEAAAAKLSMKTYIATRPIHTNPFLIADDLREFVSIFATTWERIKMEGWHGLPRSTDWWKVFVKKMNALLRENQKMKPAQGYKRAGPVGNQQRVGRPRKKKAQESDDEE